MLEQSDALDRLALALSHARTLGADAADGVYFGDLSSSVNIRLGEIEDIDRSESEEIGIRVFSGTRSASVSSSDLSAAAIRNATERALAMAKEAPEDKHAGLADTALLASDNLPALDLDDGGEIAMETLRDQALATENAARAVTGITNSQGASASAGRAVYALATSNGFARSYSGSSYGASAAVIAGEGAAMQRDYAYHSARHHADLEDPASIGTRAGDRAVARLGPLKLKTGAYPVLFDPRVGPTLLGHLISAINGAAIARKTSFLLDALGTQVFAPNINIIDEPHRIRGLRSRPFDGEGLATARTEIIDNGILNGWLMDSAAARQLGSQPTGHAARGVSGPPSVGTSNLYLAAGTPSPGDLMADIGTGILVTELIGQGVNGLTGDYSRGASGFLIKDGEIAGPVDEITIAGNLKDMFAALIPANDLVFRYASNTPTLRIDGMTVAGS